MMWKPRDAGLYLQAKQQPHDIDTTKNNMYRRSPLRGCQILIACLVLLCFSFVTFFNNKGFSRQAAYTEFLPAKLFLEHDGSGRNVIKRPTGGDRKLGFSSIKFINMPHRFDRSDAATLQAYLSGLDLEYHPAVEPSDIHDVGMPPSSNGDVLKPGEKGCWRAHANIWAEMLRKNIPTVLILESDAAWDINIRPIMAKLSEEFGAFLRASGSKPLYQDKSAEEISQNKNQQSQRPIQQEFDDVDDPWHSSHWDIFSLGPCYDELKLPSTYHQYHDPFGPLSAGLSLSTEESPNSTTEQSARERMIYRSGGPVCTTAYAVTKRGAAKLLARTAMNLNAPLDMIIRHMVQQEELVAYGTIPTVMAQWDYVPGIGMEKRGTNGAGSDIFRGDQQKDDDRRPAGKKTERRSEVKKEDEDDMPGWERVMETKFVWTLKSGQPHALFKEMALQKAWERIFSAEKNIED